MKTELGFTLLELLVAIAIIGIISGIALPQYAEYRQRGFDARARSDLYMVALAEESYFIDNETYLSCSDANCSDLPGVSRISNGVSISIIATDQSFTGTSSHPKGSGKVYNWDSEAGGLAE